MITRRHLVTAVAPLVAAPAIVRASSLMPVRAIEPSESETVRYEMARWYREVVSSRLNDQQEGAVVIFAGGRLNVNGLLPRG